MYVFISWGENVYNTSGTLKRNGVNENAQSEQVSIIMDSLSPSGESQYCRTRVW